MLITLPITARARRRRRSSGLTLIELVITLSIIAIVVGYAVPSFNLLAEKQRLRGAAETLFAQLQLARSDAIRHGQPVWVTLRADAPGRWCYGLSLASRCDCRAAALASDSCTIRGQTRRVDSAEFRDIRLAHPPPNAQSLSFSFSPLRGTTRAGRVEFAAPSGRRLRLVRSGLGRLRLCTPRANAASSMALSGYPAC